MTMMRPLMVAAFAVCVAGPAVADADASIKYRQNAMKTIGAQLGSISSLLKGEVDNQDALGRHAALLGQAASTEITIPAFKENTDGQGSTETRATAAIWNEWAKFEAYAKDLETAALAAADAGGGVSGEHLRALGAACKACHDDFRQR